MRAPTGTWSHRFRLVLRPMRDPDGPLSELFLDARTIAQATREATARHPKLKVVSAHRWKPTPTTASPPAPRAEPPTAPHDPSVTPAPPAPPSAPRPSRSR